MTRAWRCAVEALVAYYRDGASTGANSARDWRARLREEVREGEPRPSWAEVSAGMGGMFDAHRPPAFVLSIRRMCADNGR